jgi:hypothetical protein
MTSPLCSVALASSLLGPALSLVRPRDAEGSVCVDYSASKRLFMVSSYTGCHGYYYSFSWEAAGPLYCA